MEEDCAAAIQVTLTKVVAGDEGGGSVVLTANVAAGVPVALPRWALHTGAMLPLADTAATTPVHDGADSPSLLAHAAAVLVAA